MRVAALAAVALVALGCPQTRSVADGSVPPGKVGLKVPLPDGWVAHPGAGGVLQVGPGGHVVMTVEHRPEEHRGLPDAGAVPSALREEGVMVLGELPLPDGWLLRYQWPGHEQALLGARQLPTGLLLCASSPGATLDEVKQAAALCTEIGATP